MQNSLFKIEVAKDKKSARLTVFSFDGLTKELIYDEMLRQNIKKGVIIKNISLLFADRLTDFPVEIARFQSPLKAVQDSFKWQIDLKTAPKEKGGRVDYYDLDYLKDVLKDSLLFTMRAGVSGAAGYLIDGTPISGEDLSGLALAKKMQNIRLAEKDGLIYGYAEINGVLTADDKGIRVEKKVIINSNVDFKTGHLITRYADLEINGNTASRFKISSPGTVVLNGNLQNSSVEAENLIITGKIMQGDCLIRVKNLTAAEIHNRKNVYVDNCTVEGRLGTSEIGIGSQAKIGEIADSIVFVRDSLEADLVGNDSSRETVIILGVDKEMHDKQDELVKMIKKQRKIVKELNMERVKVRNELTELELFERKNRLDDLQQQKKKLLTADLVMLEEDHLRESRKEIELIDEHNKIDLNDFNRDAFMQVKTKIYHGVRIFLGLNSSIRLQKDYGPCRIGADEEGVLVILNQE